MASFGRWAAVCAVAMSVSAAAWAQIPPTPAGWGPEQAASKTSDYVARQLDVVKSNAPDRELKPALRRIQMLRPDDPVALAQLALKVGPEGSDQDFLDILAFRPDDDLANLYLAGNLSDEGYVDLALPFFAKAAAQRPEAGWLQYDAGMNAFFAEDDAACITYLGRAISAGLAGDRTLTQAYLKRGECYARAGKTKEAKADFSKIEGYGGAYSVRMLSDGAYGKCQGGSLDARTKKAAAIADDWKTYEGYRDLTKVLVCDPKHIGALTERLKLESRDRNLTRHHLVHSIQLKNLQDGGKTYADRAAPLQPRSAAEMLTEGQAADMTNEAGRMRAAYLASRVLMMEPGNAQARLLRARAITNLGIGPLAALAWDDATRALQSDPKLATAHFVRALLFTRGNGLNEAATELTAAIAISPGDMRFYALRGEVYAELGRNEPAIQDLTRVLASSPKDMTSLISRAKANHGLGRHQAALNDLDAAFGVDPKNFRVRAATVQVLDAVGRRDDADAVHIMLLQDFATEAKASDYLSKRASPALLAKAETVKNGLALQARETRAQDQFQRFVNEYSPAENVFDTLLYQMGRADSATDPEKAMANIRSSAESADRRLKTAKRLGSDLLQSDLAEALSPELLGKLASYLSHVESMQADLARIQEAMGE